MKKYMLWCALVWYTSCAAIQIPNIISTIWLSIVIHGWSLMFAQDQDQDTIQTVSDFIEQREEKPDIL